MVMSEEGRAYYKALGLLGQERNVDRVKRILVADGMKPMAADDLVDSVHADIRSHNRKKAVMKFVISGLLLLVFGGIYVFTGRLFFIMLPLAGIGAIWGFIKFVTASGYELDSADEDDE